jgi:hypothetical protein
LKLVPLLQQSLFFFRFSFTKVAKTTKQNKTNFFTNTKKEIRATMKEKIYILKENKKRGVEASPLSKLGDGAHLCPKTTKQKKRKKEKKGVQMPLLLRLGNGTIGTQRQHDKKKK